MVNFRSRGAGIRDELPAPPSTGDHAHGRRAMNNQAAGELTSVGTVDIEAFAKNSARLIEEAGKAVAAYLKPREEGQIKSEMPDEAADVVKTLGQVAEYWLSDPQRAFELQS